MQHADKDNIATFVEVIRRNSLAAAARHLGMPKSTVSRRLVRLEDAPFWTSAQARLLRESLVMDADWAEVVDRLNLALHNA